MMSRYSIQEMRKKAKDFSKNWKDQGHEKQQAQMFITDFLNIFGLKIDIDMKSGSFEYGAGKGWMDAVVKGKIGIEMKSRTEKVDIALDELKNYLLDLPDSVKPEILLACNFETMLVFNRVTNDTQRFKVSVLNDKLHLFESLFTASSGRVYEVQMDANIKAAEKMAKLHDEMKSCGYEGEDLEIYLVRLLFCMFAEDTYLFKKSSVLHYIIGTMEHSDLASRITSLFDILNVPEDHVKRAHLSDELKEFPYVNGKLFEKTLSPPIFNAKMKQALTECARFDWSKISPAIFGAMFQGVMDEKRRREIGAHYTSEENILKLIRPLFLDGLWEEYRHCGYNEKALEDLHEKIRKMKFLDPACGCGNFLIIAYRELRLMELEILKRKEGTIQQQLDISHMFRVSIEQFYGIEYEEFPCQIAQVGMWLIEHQMNLLAQDVFGRCPPTLPLNQKAHIIQGNALQIDWNNVVPKKELSYIMGNPPFVGYPNQSDEQKNDVRSACTDFNGKEFKNAGKIDYVAAWYYKAAKYIQNSQIRTAFVSVNSITQGEQVASVWKPLLNVFGVKIDFAYRTFKWSNDAKNNATVHCVIIGFSLVNTTKKIIYDGEEKLFVNNINPYLVDAPDVFVESRRSPICKVPIMQKGSVPADDGNLIIKEKEYNHFIEIAPNAKEFIREFLGGDEFIYGTKRYCLWLAGIPQAKWIHIPEVERRIKACREYRSNSKRSETRKFADFPFRFIEIRQPESDFLAIPEVSSENRQYIPMGYLPSATIASNKLFTVPDATLYHFGILTSSVHMAWIRAVCGRLEMRYSYSTIIVYNTFPWPVVSEEQKGVIEKLSQDVLDARAKEMESGNNLAGIYDKTTIPEEVFKAHNRLDNAVKKLYGYVNLSEAEIVADLMNRYQKLIDDENLRMCRKHVA